MGKDSEYQKRLMADYEKSVIYSLCVGFLERAREDAMKERYYNLAREIRNAIECLKRGVGLKGGL